MKPHITKRQGRWRALRPLVRFPWGGNIDTDEQVVVQILYERYAVEFAHRLNERNRK